MFRFLCINVVLHDSGIIYLRCGICALACCDPSVDIVQAVMIVWRIRGIFIRAVQCCTVYHNCTHMWTVLISVLGYAGLGYTGSVWLFWWFLFVLLVYFILFLLRCQYQCKWLPRKTGLWNSISSEIHIPCVKQDVTVKPYSLVHLHICTVILGGLAWLLCCVFIALWCLQLGNRTINW